MRASRLLSLLLLMQTRGRMTAQQLAHELEVSVRTIYRDVDALSAAGVPLYGDAGHAGGYQLLDGYRTRLTGLTAAEAEALFLSGLPGPAAELGLGSVLAAATLKLRAALPASLRENADRLSERFYLDAPGWYRRPEDVPYLPVVVNAVWDRQVIQVTLPAMEGADRGDPAAGAARAGPQGRHLVHRGPLRGAMRTYRVDQIVAATACGCGFTASPDSSSPATGTPTWPTSTAAVHRARGDPAVSRGCPAHATSAQRRGRGRGRDHRRGRCGRLDTGPRADRISRPGTRRFPAARR